VTKRPVYWSGLGLVPTVQVCSAITQEAC